MRLPKFHIHVARRANLADKEGESMSRLSVSTPEVRRTDDEGGLRAPAHLSRFGKIWWWFDFLILVNLARLRFIGVLVAIFAVILYWDTLKAHYEKWTRPAGEISTASVDFDFWCPMHP